MSRLKVVLSGVRTVATAVPLSRWSVEGGDGRGCCTVDLVRPLTGTRGGSLLLSRIAALTEAPVHRGSPPPLDRGRGAPIVGRPRHGGVTRASPCTSICPTRDRGTGPPRPPRRGRPAPRRPGAGTRRPERPAPPCRSRRRRYPATCRESRDMQVVTVEPLRVPPGKRQRHSPVHSLLLQWEGAAGLRRAGAGSRRARRRRSPRRAISSSLGGRRAGIL